MYQKEWIQPPTQEMLASMADAPGWYRHLLEQENEMGLLWSCRGLLPAIRPQLFEWVAQNTTVNVSIAMTLDGALSDKTAQRLVKRNPDLYSPDKIRELELQARFLTLFTLLADDHFAYTRFPTLAGLMVAGADRVLMAHKFYFDQVVTSEKETLSPLAHFARILGLSADLASPFCQFPLNMGSAVDDRFPVEALFSAMEQSAAMVQSVAPVCAQQIKAMIAGFEQIFHPEAGSDVDLGMIAQIIGGLTPTQFVRQRLDTFSLQHQINGNALDDQTGQLDGWEQYDQRAQIGVTALMTAATGVIAGLARKARISLFAPTSRSPLVVAELLPCSSPKTTGLFKLPPPRIALIIESACQFVRDHLPFSIKTDNQSLVISLSV